MKKSIVTLLTIICIVPMLSAKNYYLDSSTGQDSHDGASPASPWRSLEKINSIVFSGGDTIHFVNGGEWRGYFEPKGSGQMGNPIVVKSYGPSLKRPKIDGEGRTGKGVIYLHNQSHWEISELELTNDAPQGGDRRGVWVTADNAAGVLSHIYLRDLHIHHIKGKVGQGRDAKRTSGIAFTTFDGDNECRFDDIWIDGCIIHDCDNQGIVTELIKGSGGYPQSEKWRNVRITNSRITGNLIYNISKNAMIIRLFEGGVVEHNLCYNTAIGTGRGMTGNTIFSAACDGTIFQFNEGYGNCSPAADGSLYDADLRSPNTIWQYSLSHNNAHGLFWGCTTPPDTGIECKYNVSYNDRGIIFCVNYPVEQMQIFNNTVIVGEGLGPVIISERGMGGDQVRNYTFKDNVIWGGDRYFTYLLADQHYNRDICSNDYFGGRYTATPEDLHAQVGDSMLSQDSFKSSPILNTMQGKGAFAQGAGLPEEFTTMDFLNNFRIPGESIYAGQQLAIESDDQSASRKIHIKILNPKGEEIYSKKLRRSDNYKLGAVCLERGVHHIEFTTNQRVIRKKLWVK